MDTNISRELFTLGFSAFAGAFFAYLFTRIADFFSKVYQRQVKHYNSLVNLDTQLNEIGGIINDDLYIIPEFVRVISSGHIYFNNLRPLPIDKSHYENLYDLDLINILFSYNYELRKINDDIDTVSRGYDKIESAFTQKNITPEEYLYNCKNLAATLVVQKLFLTKLQDKTTRLIARIRIESKNDMPLGTKLQSLFTKTNGPKITKAEIDTELKKLEKEIEETRTSSRMEIDETLKEAGLLDIKR
ncbi:MAG: hypothetical protein WCT01_03765 [Candidatus Shapirobacteria bacterium]